jgi:hypothetical protein
VLIDCGVLIGVIESRPRQFPQSINIQQSATNPQSTLQIPNQNSVDPQSAISNPQSAKLGL